MTEPSTGWDNFAVLLIDVQKDFWTEEMKIAFPDFHDNVANLLDRCRRDGIDVIHLQAKFRKDRSDWMARYLLGDTIPCIDGRAGSRAFDCALPIDGEPVVIKQTFDGFFQPELDERLSAGDKRYLLVAGLVTSVCVLLTAASAAQRGYLVSVIEDCCADKPEAHEHTLERYPFVFDVTTSATFEENRSRWLEQIETVAAGAG